MSAGRDGVPGAAASYAERVARHVPALEDLHRMTGLLLAEHVGATGRVLVLGAGGGLELRAMAGAHPGWRFDGVDPSPEMLAQARETLGPMAERVTFHEGYIEEAPEGPFDGATCLLTLHFLPRAERLRTLRRMRARLSPGAPLVVAHHSIPAGRQDLWLRRNAGLLVSRGVQPEAAAQGVEAIRARLPVLSPDEDAALLRDAGFDEVELFFAAFTYRGWVARRG